MSLSLEDVILLQKTFKIKRLFNFCNYYELFSFELFVFILKL